MKDYIDSYLEILPDDQKKRLSKIIDEFTKVSELNIDISDSDIEMVLNYILSKNVLLDKSYMNDTLDSLSFNYFMKKIYISIVMLYEQLKNLNLVLNKMNTIDNRNIHEIRSYISLVENEIHKLRYVEAMQEEKSSVISFNTSSVFEINKESLEFYKDRDGSLLDIADIDHECSVLSLQKIKVENAIKESNAKVYIQRYHNVYKDIKSIDNIVIEAGNIEDIYDGNIDTSYINLLLTTDQSTTQSGYTIQIDFNNKVTINNIVIKVLSKYPVQLSDILVKSTNYPGNDYIKINTESIVSINGLININFMPINANSIRLKFIQQSYVNRQINLFHDQLNYNYIVDNILSKEIAAIKNNYLLSQDDINKITGYIGWLNAYNNFLERYRKFVEALTSSGYYWTEDQIIAYIKSKL